jgi:phenylacetate-coenzyme A ligase PaaK-like adenylate-forming protein
MARIKGRLDEDVILAEGMTLNMAEMDEALFLVDGLLDFNAELTRNGNTNCLEIRAKIIDTPGSEMETAILGAVDTIPSVKSLKYLGILDITVRTGIPMAIGTAKRTLIDKRWD